MADVMDGAARLHWFEFRVEVDGEVMARHAAPVWRRDSENTDDYTEGHPAMIARARQKLLDRYSDEHKLTYSGEVFI